MMGLFQVSGPLERQYIRIKGCGLEKLFTFGQTEGKWRNSGRDMEKICSQRYIPGTSNQVRLSKLSPTSKTVKPAGDQAFKAYQT